MKTVLQRVSSASVRVDDQVVGAIDQGVLLLVGVERGDCIFPGRTPMDRTLADVGGACLVVSQFTLLASLRKGNRPGFGHAADPAVADALYLRVAEGLRATGLEVATGEFGAKMHVALVNDGPVTLIVEAREGRIQA